MYIATLSLVILSVQSYVWLFGILTVVCVFCFISFRTLLRHIKDYLGHFKPISFY